MPTFDRIAAREQLARNVLVSKEEAQRYLDQARLAGKRREAISWEAHLRKINKLIAQYGMDRYVPGPKCEQRSA